MSPLTQPPRVLVAFVLLAGLAADPAHGWGRTGHRVVGQIAANHLSPAAARGVAELLAPETLAEAGTWADEIRSDPAWNHAAAWHWVNIEPGATYASSAKNPEGDILEALARFEKVLRDPRAERRARLEALKFLVHFLGDLHQPLHAGYGKDRGGNEIPVRWFGQPSNLHRVWDDGLIGSEELSFSEWVRFLDRAEPAQIRAWQTGTYLDWAEESRAVLGQVYDFEGARGDPPELGYRYVWRNLPLVKQRLLQAGVRLAGVLDAVFAPDAPADP